MTGIVAAGVGIGELVGPPIVSRLIASHNWRTAYTVFGSTVLGGAILAAQILRNPMEAVVDTTIDRWFTEPFRRSGGPSRSARDFSPWTRKRGRKAGGRWRTSHTAPRLSSIQVPTLCLAGENDVSATPPAVQAIAQAIPGARVCGDPRRAAHAVH